MNLLPNQALAAAMAARGSWGQLGAAGGSWGQPGAAGGSRGQPGADGVARAWFNRRFKKQLLTRFVLSILFRMTSIHISSRLVD